MRVALGFGWLVWCRARIALAATVGSVALTWAISESPFAPYASAFGGMYFAIAATALLGMLTFTDSTDISATDGSYPKHLFLLPVQSRSLALWPALFGAMTLVTVWVAFASAAVYPSAGLSGVVVPAIGLVALLTSLQALGWMPLPLPFLRSGLVVVIGCALAGAGPVAMIHGVAPTAVGVGYGLFSLAAFAAATWGIAASRTGITLERERTSKRALRKDDAPRPPFRSAMASQVWIECRHDGLILPMIATFLAAMFALPYALANGHAPVTIGMATFDPSCFNFAIPFLLMPFLSSSDGCCMSIRDNFRPDFSLITFLAVRPMSDSAIVGSKMRMALRATFRAWAILSIGLVLLAFQPVQAHGVSTTFGGLVATQAGGRGLALGGLGLSLLVFLTWRATVSAMWLRLCHRFWVRNGIGFFLLLFPVAVGFYLWSHGYLDDPQFQARAIRWSGAILGALATFKLVAGLALARKIRRLGLISDGTIGRWLAVSVAVGAALFFVVRGLSVPVPPAPLAGAIFLLVPLVRIPLAVLTLHFNRHR